MDEPLYVMSSAAQRWTTTVNYDLLIYESRFLWLRAFDFRSLRERTLERQVAGRARSVGGALSRQERWANERLVNALKTSEDELLAASPDNRAVRTELIEAARLVKRPGWLKLRLLLVGTERVTWMWMNRFGRYEEVHTVLRRVLGERVAS